MQTDLDIISMNLCILTVLKDTQQEISYASLEEAKTLLKKTYTGDKLAFSEWTRCLAALGKSPSHSQNCQKP